MVGEDFRLQVFKGKLEGYKSGRDYGLRVGKIEGQLDVVGDVLSYISLNMTTLAPDNLIKGIAELCWKFVEGFEKVNPAEPNSEFDKD